MFEGNLQFYNLFCFILYCCFITAKYPQVIDDYSVCTSATVLNVLRMFLTFKVVQIKCGSSNDDFKKWPMQLGYIKIQILCIAAQS